MSWEEVREWKSADGQTGADDGEILVKRGVEWDFNVVCDQVSGDVLTG